MIRIDTNKVHLIPEQDELFLWSEGLAFTYEPNPTMVEKDWRWFALKAKEIMEHRGKTPLSLKIPEAVLFPDKILVVKDVVLENWADVFWLWNLIIYPRIVKKRNSTILISPIETSLDYIIKPADTDDLVFQVYKDKIQWSRKELFRVIGPNYQDSQLPMTETEEILYKAMLKNGLNPKPQFSIKNETNDVNFDYRVDFAFEKGHVYIECDDESHWKDERTIAKDRKRAAILSNFGWRGIRFTNYKIKHHTEECVKEICEFLESKDMSSSDLTSPNVEEVPKLDGLDESQRKAAMHINGPAVVIAGPGAGKTKAMVKRVEFLLKNGIEPDTIVCITFTNKAANELKERLEKTLKGKSYKLNISTIHSFCLNKIVKPYYSEYRKEKFNFKIGNLEKDLKPVFNGLKKKIKVNIDYDEAKRFISNLKGRFIKPDEFRQLLDNPEKMKPLLNKSERTFTKNELDFIAELYNRYETLKAANKKIDFDDILAMSYSILKNDNIFRRHIQLIYQYILADEHQDTGQYVHRLLMALAAPQDNFFVIGDDDQSIYGFRGAEPDLLLNFDMDYPNFSLYKLETNYRSKAAIVEYANRMIKENANRYHGKNIKPKQEGGNVEIKAFDNEILEAISVAETIKTLIIEKKLLTSKEKPPFAILTRTRNLSVHIIEELIKRGINFIPPPFIDTFYNNDGIRQIISYMRIATYGYLKPCEEDWIGRKQGAFATGYEGILNVPNRYIDKNEFANILYSGKNFFKDFDVFAEHFKHRRKQLENLKRGLDSIISAIKRQFKLSKIVELIRSTFSLDNYFLRHDYFGNKDESIVEDMNMFQVNVDRFLHLIDLFSFIEDFPKKIAENEKAKPYVFVNTIHSSKGLEFNTVFLPLLNNNIFPHKRNNDIEEERRLFYVGITRAEDSLFLSYNRTIGGKEALPSPFLLETGNE